MNSEKKFTKIYRNVYKILLIKHNGFFNIDHMYFFSFNILHSFTFKNSLDSMVCPFKKKQKTKPELKIIYKK